MCSCIGKTSWNKLIMLLLFYDQSAAELEKLNNERIIHVILNRIIIISYCIIFMQAIYSANKRITAGNLLNEFNSRL